MSILGRNLRITMPDGSQWDTPIQTIAESRAKQYADEFDGDVQRSLNEDTVPLFESTPYAIRDWASNNMNWKDVEAVSSQVKPSSDVDFQDGWVNGDWEIV